MNNFGAARLVWLMFGAASLFVIFILSKEVLIEFFLEAVRPESIFMIYAIFTIYNLFLFSAIINLGGYKGNFYEKTVLLFIISIPIVGTIGAINIYARCYESEVLDRRSAQKKESIGLFEIIACLIALPFLVIAFIFMMLALCLAQALNKEAEYRTFEDEFYAS